MPSPSSLPRLIFTGALLFLTLVFLALGTWQVQRLFWKLDLIARVDARVHAAAVQPPADWSAITADRDEYRHVTATGTFDHNKEVLVQAVTERGAGFWVVTPLSLKDGTTVLVNRGFVPADRRDSASRAEGQITGNVQITGLLRITEPDGAFLRSNDPQNGRWYSRDVAAIAKAAGLANTAPYFIDADATPNPGGLPIGGLTIVQFRNSHLVYALTWFAMALMSTGAAWFVYRRRLS
ncbi:SURF1 family protein [Rhizobium sp. XQZ8]|uniref:SURF1 family protein n=1 Tax=Rhizobium populisoli TaxID=2859785 RepID=UPI001CA54233|nr:SURF1 family protein [Rhizobium populisoli]MBW6422119.1 SURF1 family protein [Rhizobium populisoli]